MSSGARFLAVPVLGLLLVLPPCGSAGWSFTEARHLPATPDHEYNTTFRAAVKLFNDTAGANGSASNGTGTNGTGTNGTGTNGTGQNGTGLNQTVNLTACRLVIEPRDDRSAIPSVSYNMTREGPGEDFRFTLGPWPPGTEIPYHFEAVLSNGTVLWSNTSWVRTPDLLEVKWHYSLDEAMRLARELGRPLMVLVHSGFAQTNRWLDENLSRPGITALSADFVCCRVDNETSPAFSLEHGLRRLPVLVFVNATTGNLTARLENPFDGPMVERQMRHLLGKGPEPAPAPDAGPGYRLEAALLGAALVAGPVAMYALLRRRRRNQ